MRILKWRRRAPTRTCKSPFSYTENKSIYQISYIPYPLFPIPSPYPYPLFPIPIPYPYPLFPISYSYPLSPIPYPLSPIRYPLSLSQLLPQSGFIFIYTRVVFKDSVNDNYLTVKGLFR